MSFKTLLAATAALALAAPAWSQTAGADAGEFTAEAFRSHVAFLADDLLEGREPGTRGYDIAAHYVASEMAGLGLRPGNRDSWFQPVEFARVTAGDGATLTIGGQTFRRGTDYVTRVVAAREPVRADVPLVFVGYGLDGGAVGRDDYAGLDVRGKVVVVLSGTPDDLPSDIAAHLNNQKARAAADHGAIGMISIRTPADIADAPWARMLAYGTRPQVMLVGDNGQPDPGHNLQLSALADMNVAEAMFAGASRPLRSVFRDADRGRPVRGFPLAQTIRIESPATTETRFTSPNVVAILPGTDPALASEYVLLMAHLDAFGVLPEGQRPESQDRIRNGALDNATGVSTLIEVARQMSRPGHRPRRPVIFAAVTAEELGLLGANFLSHHPVTGGGRIVGLVNLDMPILTYDFQDVIAFGAEHSTLGPIVQRAAARMGVTLSPDPLPEEGLFTRSDHYNFVRQGVPSVFLMTGFGGNGREQFTSFLEHQYHGPDDDMNQAIDWAAGAKFARLNYLIAREIADGDAAPLWYADSFFGRTFGAGQRMAQRPAGSGSAAAR